MTPDPQDLPPLDLLIRRLPKYMRDTESARASLKEMCAPLLAKIEEFTKHFDDVEREIDELEVMVEKVKQRAEAAERERDELRAKLETAANAVPSSWLDPLLSGPEAIGPLPLDGNKVERLLKAIRARIDAARAEKP